MMFFIMAQIGGLYSFFKLVFGSIINAIQYKMMLIDVINRYNNRRIEDSIKRRKSRQLEKALQHEKRLINLNNSPEDSKVNDGGEEQYFVNPHNHTNNRDSRYYISRDIEESMRTLDVKQNVFEYNYADLLYQSICCFKTKPNNVSTLEDNLGTRHNQFIRDMEKFNKDIDAINLISTIKNLKHKANDLYAEIQKLKNQKATEPQTDKDSSKDTTKKNKLNSSQFELVQQKPSLNDQIIDKPKESKIDEKSEENKINEKLEDSFNFEAASDLNNVGQSFYYIFIQCTLKTLDNLWNIAFE